MYILEYDLILFTWTTRCHLCAGSQSCACMSGAGACVRVRYDKIIQSIWRGFGLFHSLVPGVVDVFGDNVHTP